jgi:hypothetical protein
MIPFKLCTPNSIELDNYAGDTWNGMTIRGSVGGENPSEQLPKVISAKLQFRTLARRFVYELNTETGSENGLPTGYPNNTTGNITLIDADMWTISVDAQPLPMSAGTYIWELEVIDALNVKRSLLAGTITICRSISN